MHITDYLYIEDLPQDCIKECSAQGSVDAAVEYWQNELSFTVDRDKAIRCLKEYGAWDLDQLNSLDDQELAQKILWLACCDFKEHQYDPERYGSDVYSIIG